METVFDRDTNVTRNDDGSYEATVGEAWQIVHGPNGGYLAAIVLNALLHEVADPARSPRSLTVHFLRPPAEGPVRIDATIERQGRTLTSASARMSQDGKLLALALAAFSMPFNGPELVDVRLPDVPLPEDLEDVDTRPLPRHVQNFVYRHALGELFSGGSTGEVAAWMRLLEPRALDPLLLTTLTDTAPPAVFTWMEGPNPAPTVDLTIHFRSPIPRDAAPEDFYLGHFRTKLSREGFFEEDGAIYTRSGILLAQSRQLAILRALPG